MRFFIGLTILLAYAIAIDIKRIHHEQLFPQSNQSKNGLDVMMEIKVSAVDNAKVATRLGVLLPRNLNDVDRAAAAITLNTNPDRDVFRTAVVNAVKTKDPDIDDKDNTVQNKLVDRAIFKTLRVSYAAIFEKMRTFRLTWEPALDSSAVANASRKIFIDTISPNIYLHVTRKTDADTIVTEGLKPSQGGSATVASNSQSVAVVRDLNVDKSRGKSYVSRSLAEIRQYYGDTGTKQVLMIYICSLCEDDKNLKLDPDSQHGVYFKDKSLGLLVSSKTTANAAFIKACSNALKSANQGPTKTLFDAEGGAAAFITALHTFLTGGLD